MRCQAFFEVGKPRQLSCLDQQGRLAKTAQRVGIVRDHQNACAAQAFPKATLAFASERSISDANDLVHQIGVKVDSDAGRKGLQRGDIILSANYTETASIAALEAIIGEAEADGREAVLLRIQRRGRPAQYVAVRMR